MKKLESLYQTAARNGIDVISFQMNKAEALSVVDLNGRCSIAIDPKKLTDEVDETLKLAHDLGHCMAGAFYNRYSKYEVVSQKEFRANQWAVHELLPFYELEKALRKGIVQKWELAEYFDLTESFVSLAISIYQQENLL